MNRTIWQFLTYVSLVVLVGLFFGAAWFFIVYAASIVAWPMVLALVLVFAALLLQLHRIVCRSLEQRNKSLAKTLEAKHDFMRMVNHQLMTPFSILQNTYTMMMDGSLDMKKGLAYWASGLSRMNQVMQDLHDFLQSEKEALPRIKKQDIVPIVNAIVQDRENTISVFKKPINLELQNPDFPVPKVLCDLRHVQVVLHNLLDNALVYTLQGTITVSYHLVANHYLAIRVEDTGIGFSKNEAADIGHKFYRSQRAVSVRPEGTGLGLYICRHILEHNKGKLFYESHGEGKGAVFGFALPIAK
jgi:two-component system, OmpR family, sensor histidine kinase BaeS